jgi:hypothetical protein
MSPYLCSSLPHDYVARLDKLTPVLFNCLKRDGGFRPKKKQKKNKKKEKTPKNTDTLKLRSLRKSHSLPPKYCGFESRPFLVDPTAFLEADRT